MDNGRDVGKWSVTATYRHSRVMEYSKYNLSFVGWIVKGIYCLIKYDIVRMGKHM